MSNSLTWPALGAALFLAVAGGIQLGESTVGMINPIHFQGAAIHPRDRGAAVDERQLRSPQPRFASHYGWEEGRAARLEECGDCEAIVARDIFVETYEPDTSVHRASIEGWEDPSVSYQREQSGEESEDLRPRDLDEELKARVIRYAYFDVEAEADPKDDYGSRVE